MRSNHTTDGPAKQPVTNGLMRASTQRARVRRISLPEFRQQCFGTLAEAPTLKRFFPPESRHDSTDVGAVLRCSGATGSMPGLAMQLTQIFSRSSPMIRKLAVVAG